MDLGTIREKLKCLEYPDVESFVADVRLVFSNSDKYNLVITRLSLLDFKTTCSVLNLPTNWPPWGQKEVTFVERFKKTWPL